MISRGRKRANNFQNGKSPIYQWNCNWIQQKFVITNWEKPNEAAISTQLHIIELTILPNK